MSYKINENYFDIIDSEEKAYWLGFWWCDGYVGKRERWQEKYNKYRTEYNFKCSLQVLDKSHLEKFKICLSSSHPIKIYKNSTGFKKKNPKEDYKVDFKEARLYITNTHMGSILQNKYGLIPNRFDCNKLINDIPNNLMRHFIRGVLDADGSFSWYFTNDKGYTVLKCNVQFTTYEMLINYIEEYLYKQNIINSKDHKYECRHKDKDAYCRTLHLSGRNQAIKVLNYLYSNATIYLDRKYIKYKEMIKSCA